MRFLLAVLVVSPLGAQLLVETYAGGTIPSGIPANNVALGAVSSLTWDSSGNVVFCDTTSNVIRRISPDGLLRTVAGTGVTTFAGDGGPAINASISNPLFLKYDVSGNLYFFDAGNFRIRRVDPTGTITSIAGDGQYSVVGLNAPGSASTTPITANDLAPDGSGNLYIAGDDRITRLTPSGDLQTVARVSGAQKLAVDSSGNIYVFSNSGSGSLMRVSPAGTVSTFVAFAGPGAQVGGLTTDASGNLHALANGKITLYSPDGKSTTLPTPPGIVSASEACLDPHGNLAFVAFPIVYNFRPIQTFSNESVLTTVAGGNPLPAPDGTPLSQTWLLAPQSLAFSGAGDLYIAESGACLIRKITAAGVLSTFAGTGNCEAPMTAKSVYPSSIAIDRQGTVWVLDYMVGLYSISQTGARSSVIRAPVEGNNQQLAVDAQGRIYVMGSRSLYRVLPDLTYEPIVRAGGADVLGIGSDSSGNVYVSASFVPTTNPAAITYVVNDDLTLTPKYPGFGVASIAFDPRGHIWGSGAGVLYTDNPSGTFLGFDIGFAGDGGPLQSARTSAYGSIAFGPGGNLYFIDNGLRIRRLTGAGPSAPPVISTNGIVNAATYTGGNIAPGEIVSIFGTNFGSESLQINAAVNNAVPHAITRTKVQFRAFDESNLVGTITAITANQINVFVPHGLTPGTSVNVQVQVDDILSTAMPMTVSQTAPGISPSILNQDGTLNSVSNPALRGSIVSFYGTGLGAMSPQLLDGYLAISTPYSMPVNSPSLSIGGQPALILYAGDAPTLSTGVFQINATIPSVISPGPALVSLTIGGVVTQGLVFVK